MHAEPMQDVAGFFGSGIDLLSSVVNRTIGHHFVLASASVMATSKD